MPPSSAADKAKLAEVSASCSSASLRPSEAMDHPLILASARIEGGWLRHERTDGALGAGVTSAVGQAFALEQGALGLVLLAALLLGQFPLCLGPGRRQFGLLFSAHFGDLHAALDQLGLLLVHHPIVFPMPDLLGLTGL